jgi:phage-related protein
VIKFLPPLNITKEDIDYFLAAIQQVLDNTQRVTGGAWTTVMSLAKGALRA